jgi:hypothetical protein
MPWSWRVRPDGVQPVDPRWEHTRDLVGKLAESATGPVVHGDGVGPP